MGHQLQNLRPLHMALCDWMILNPELTYKDAAREFGISPVTVTNITGSDLFKDLYSRRRDELHGPAMASVRDRLESLAQLSAQRLTDKVAIADNPSFLLDVVTKMADRIGLAPKAMAPATGPTFNGPVQINNHPVTKTLLAEAREMLQARQRVAAPLALAHDESALSEAV